MRLFPSRAQVKPQELVADLDSLVESRAAFKLHGKMHMIEPMNTIQFMQFASALSDLNKLREKDGLKPDELLEAYYNLSHSVVPSIEKKDIEQMTQQQIGALYQLILDKVLGRNQESEKKKTNLNLKS